jgi:hypothetical protein
MRWQQRALIFATCSTTSRSGITGTRRSGCFGNSAPLQNAPADLGDRLAPTVYGLVHCGRGDQMVKVFLASVQVGYARQEMPGFAAAPDLRSQADVRSPGMPPRIPSRIPFGRGAPTAQICAARALVRITRTSDQNGGSACVLSDLSPSLSVMSPFGIAGAA